MKINLSLNVKNEKILSKIFFKKSNRVSEKGNQNININLRDRSSYFEENFFSKKNLGNFPPS